MGKGRSGTRSNTESRSKSPTAAQEPSPSTERPSESHLVGVVTFDHCRPFDHRE
jgi:hypothetical protein